MTQTRPPIFWAWSIQGGETHAVDGAKYWPSVSRNHENGTRGVLSSMSVHSLIRAQRWSIVMLFEHVAMHHLSQMA
jgi:hypothetical protein